MDRNSKLEKHESIHPTVIHPSAKPLFSSYKCSVSNMATAVDENAALTKTFDSKATADLEKVTDYEEDKEIIPVNIGNVSVIKCNNVQ